MIDLEPRVLNTIMSGPFKGLYNPENIYIDDDGGGAGNNVSRGRTVRWTRGDADEREGNSGPRGMQRERGCTRM
jgi:hypothetical protein